VLTAHGGVDKWNELESIDVIWNFSGWLLSVKGYPEHYQPTITINTKKQHSVIRNLGGGPDDKFIFTPGRTWIEGRNDSISMNSENPRASFAGHTRTTPWDDLQLTYFVGYALWNYLATPFCFSWPGFETREVKEHQERGETWRVLEVTYPDTFATHTKVQKFYYNDAFMLQRLDYVTDVAGGVVAHYCFDHTNIGGLVFPMTRRVVRRDPETNVAAIGGPSSFSLDYCGITLKKMDGTEIVNHGAFWSLAPQNQGK
jgi:hypothetical protein